MSLIKEREVGPMSAVEVQICGWKNRELLSACDYSMFGTAAWIVDAVEGETSGCFVRTPLKNYEACHSPYVFVLFLKSYEILSSPFLVWVDDKDFTYSELLFIKLEEPRRRRRATALLDLTPNNGLLLVFASPYAPQERCLGSDPRKEPPLFSPSWARDGAAVRG